MEFANFNREKTEDIGAYLDCRRSATEKILHCGDFNHFKPIFTTVDHFALQPTSWQLIKALSWLDGMHSQSQTVLLGEYRAYGGQKSHNG